MKFWTFGMTAFTLLLASAIAPAAQAQVKITGGNGTIVNGNIFVPTTGRFISPVGSPDRAAVEKSLVYGDKTSYEGVLIKTELGNLPANLLFRANLAPTFDTTAGQAPIVGTKGEVNGLVSFKALTKSGRPAFYNNVPTKLNVELTKVPSSSGSVLTTEWNAFDYRLTEIGVGSTPSTTTVVTRENGVRLLQYQDKGKKPVDQTVLGNSIPASAYDVQRDGISYDGKIKFDINSGVFGDGTISSAQLMEVLTNPPTSPTPTNPTNTPTPPPTNPANNPTPNPTTQTPSTRTIVIGILPVIITTPKGGDTAWYTIPGTVYSPMLKQDVKIIVRGRTIKLDDRKDKDRKDDKRDDKGRDRKDNDRKDDKRDDKGRDRKDNDRKDDKRDSDDKKPKDQKSEDQKSKDQGSGGIALDPEQVVYVDNTTQKTYVTVGLPSRVFPNFMGLEEVDLKKD